MVSQKYLTKESLNFTNHLSINRKITFRESYEMSSLWQCDGL